MSKEAYSPNKSHYQRTKEIRNSIFKPAEKAVQLYSSAMTKKRTLFDAKKLTKAETWFSGTYSLDETDPKKKTFWSEAKEKGFDRRTITTLYHLNKMGLGSMKAERFATQAISEKNYNSWLDLGNDRRRIVGEWMDRSPIASLSEAAGAASLSLIPHHPENITQLLLLGATATILAITAGSRRDDIQNHLGSRGAEEDELLLSTHFKTHEHALSKFEELKIETIGSHTKRLIEGSRSYIKDETIKLQAKAVGAGLIVAQGFQAATEGFQGSALLAYLCAPAIAGSYLYYKVRRAKSGELLTKFEETDSERIQQTNVLLGQKDTGTLSFNLFPKVPNDFSIPNLRQTLVDILQETNIKGQMTKLLPIVLVGIASINYHDTEQRTKQIASAFILSTIMQTILKPYFESVPRQVAIERAQQESQIQEKLLRRFEESEYKRPTFTDFVRVRKNLGLPEITMEEAEQYDQEPLVVHSLDMGTLKGKAIRFEGPATIPPKVTVILEPNGMGKSALLRALCFEQGNLDGHHMTRGSMDYRQLSQPFISQKHHLIEASPLLPDETLGMQLTRLFKPNFLEDLLSDFTNDYNTNPNKQWIDAKFGEDIRNQAIGFLLTEDTKLEYILGGDSYEKNELRAAGLTAWMNNPELVWNDQVIEQSRHNPDELIWGASISLLTVVFMDLVKPYYPQLTKEEAFHFITNKAGAKKGTSTGEAMRLALILAKISQPDMILVDEPEANLDTEGITQFVNEIKAQIEENPSQSFVIATTKEALIEQLGDMVVMRIKATTSEKETVFNAEPFNQDSYLPKRDPLKDRWDAMQELAQVIETDVSDSAFLEDLSKWTAAVTRLYAREFPELSQERLVQEMLQSLRIADQDDITLEEIASRINALLEGFAMRERQSTKKPTSI